MQCTCFVARFASVGFSGRRHIRVLNMQQLLQEFESEKDSAFATFQWISLSANSCATVAAGSNNRMACLTVSLSHAYLSLVFRERFH